MDNETCQVTSDTCSNGSSPAETVPTVDDSNDVREERTTKKGRRKGSKGKNDENWRYCFQNCLHSGKSPNELIQCHLANRGYTQSAWEKTGKTLSAFGHARHAAASREGRQGRQSLGAPE